MCLSLHLFFKKKSDEMAQPSKGEETEGKRKCRQYIAAFVGSLIAMSCGNLIAWSSPALPLLTRYGSRPEIDQHQGSWIGSLLTLGAFLGALPAGKMADSFGRKRLLLMMTIPLLACWMMLVWSISVYGLYIGRLLGGIVVGVVSVTVPIYINEISDDRVRGTLGTFFQLQLVVGILLMYLFGLLNDVFRMTLCCTVLPVVFFVAFYLLPESPVWLSVRGRNDLAEKSRNWLGLHTHASEPARNEKTDCVASLTFLQVIRDPASRKGMVISLGLMLFQQICGVNAVVFYTKDIYLMTGTSIDAFTASLITALVQVFSTLVSTALIDRVGRRLLLLVSFGVMTICLGCLAFFIYLTQERGYSLPGLSLLPVLSLCTYAFVFNFGAGPVAWIMMAELVRPSARGVVSAATAAVSWGLAFLVTKTFVDIREAIGVGPTFALFAVGSLLGGIFVLSSVPETKGKDINAVVSRLSGKTARNDAFI